MNEATKALLSRANFSLKRRPKIPRYRGIELRNFIPEPYKAVLLLSADLELAWAWRYVTRCPNPMEMAVQRARQARKNIPKILDMCDTYNIPITWATIGHLLLESCSKNGKVVHEHITRLPYHQNQYWIFNKGDWFDGDPCSTWKEAPEYYAPDLVRMILNARVDHEIACHTFSHIDCRNEVCSRVVFVDEIRECIDAASTYGIRLRSFVYPANMVGNLASLKELGFTSYRSCQGSVLDVPKRNKNGLWELPSTAELRYRKAWSMQYHYTRYQKIIRRGIRHNRLIYMWFHPSMEERFRDYVIASLFSHIAELRRAQQLTVMTTASYVEFLDEANRT